MCGIAGILRFSGDGASDEVLLNRALAAMDHRGGEGTSSWRDGPLTMGCTRLAVVGGPTARQPLHSPCGRWHLSFNGECYDAAMERRRLEARGRSFETQGDGEVLLAAWEDEGLKGIEGLDGMFALALWDRDEAELILLRDRFGIKPLFLREEVDRLAFASEPGALEILGGKATSPSPEGIVLFLAHGYLPPPASLREGVRAVEPGCLLRRRARDARSRHGRWWSPPSPGDETPPPMEELDEIFAERFEGAVKRRLAADGPVNLFLSGGIDSTALLAAMVASGCRAPKSWVARFEGSDLDESVMAAQSAALLGSEHMELLVDSAGYFESLLRMARLTMAPVADQAGMALEILSREARKAGKVVLLGDGADELMGGYPTERADALRPWGRLWPAFLHAPLRRLAGLFPDDWGRPSPAFRVGAFLEGCTLDAEDAHGAWRQFLPPSLLRELLGPALRAFASSVFTPYRRAFARARTKAPDSDFAFLAEGADLEVWLAGNNLPKVDGATMAANLEGRVPFLDRDLAEWLLRLPRRLRAPFPGAKPMLRRYLKAKGLPDSLTRRSKRGFHCPISRWFRSDLASSLRALFDAPRRVYADGLLLRPAVVALLDRHVQGKADHAFALQALLHFLLLHEG